MTQAAPPVYSQRTIGAYRLIARLGTGGMAEVYLALSSKSGGFNKLLVLKVMRDEVSNDPEFRAMFLDEASIAARLAHPNVINVFEVGEENGRFFIAMEYIEGQSFAALLKRTGRKPEHRGAYLRILSDTLVGLHHAHELTDYDGSALSVVHRDISPPNVLVSYDGHAKVVDFGIAKVAGSSSHTKTGVLKGKVGYMAPEQVRGDAVDRRADIFAVGVMLWDVLAGRPLVSRTDSEVTALSRRLRGDPKISAEVPDAPPALAAICERAMAFDPNDRYATALEMHNELDALLQKMEGADSKAVAALLVGHFSAERKAVKARIEQQVSSEDRTQRLTPSAEISLPLIQMSLPEESSGASGASAANSTAAVIGPSEPVAPMPSRGGRTWMVAGGLVLAAAAVGGVYATSRSSTNPQPAASSGPTVTPAPPPSAVVAEPHVVATQDAESTATNAALTVRATPPTATITIDGRAVANQTAHVLSRGSTHRLLVQAPGYVTFERSLSVDKDETVDVVLVRSAVVDPRAPVRRPAAAPSPAGATTQTPTSTTKTDEPPLGKKPQRTIDDESPYGR